MKTSTELRRLLRDCALLVLAVLGFSGLPSQAQAPRGLDVSLVVFSGRPDPQYQLQDAKLLDQLRAQLAAAKPGKAPDQGVIPAVLGYRGIMFTNGVGVAGLPRTLAVFNGIIELDKQQYVVDEGRKLERLLLDTALRQKAIDAKLHKRIVARF